MDEDHINNQTINQGENTLGADQRSVITQEKILQGAQDCFMEHGFMSSASISMIAKQAGVNGSLIFHHFKNKQGLWEAVRERLKNEFADMSGPGLEGGDDSVEGFVRLIVRIVSSIISQSHFSRVCLIGCV